MLLERKTFEDFGMQSQKRGWLPFLLSTLFHCSLLFLVIQSPPPSTDPNRSEIPIELSQLTTPQEGERADTASPPQTLPKLDQPKSQIVETEDAGNRKTDPKAAFLGEHNQAVEKQTRANRIDDFRQQKGTGAKGFPEKDQWQPPTADETQESQSEASSDRNSIKTANETPSDIGPLDMPKPPNETEGQEKKKMGGVKRNWKTLSMKDLSVGGDGGAEAATDDKLEVDRGSRTLLSTKEYKFYGYYERIKELLRQYWKPNIEHQVARILGKGKQIRQNELNTRVLVLLDETGKISKISKLASSGYSELDEAAIEAFQTAAPFPNPPKGMMDEDGFVRIHWDFILTTEASPRVQFRNLGGRPDRPIP